MDKLTKRIKDKRKNIKDNTIKSYIKSLRILNDKKDFKNISFLYNFDDIMKKIDEFKPATQKAKLASVLVALGTEDKKKDELYKKYNDKLHSISKDYYKRIEDNKKTERESENWVDLNKLMKVLNYHIRQIKKENIHKRDDKKLNKKQKRILQDYLLASLYLLQPPRRNVYADTKVISQKDFNELSETEKNDNNYLVLSSRNKKYFHFGDYKTKKKYGSQKVEVSKKLNSVINLWRHYNKDKEYLLYNTRGEKLTKNSLTKHLQKVFKVSGKNNISSSMLRHIYISSQVDNEAYKKMKKLADKMGHSVDEQQTTYYKK
tara:strand:+ start:21997 stop:22950 length:954 start_codon:yes stop_codon:yes gene_type:complete